jgi:allantoinase
MRCKSAWSRSARGGAVDLVGSDHSPSPPELKLGDDAFAAWGGIAGGQTLLRVLLTEGMPRGLSLEAVASLTAAAPARRFDLPGKGSISAGADGDLVLVDLGHEDVLRSGELLSRHHVSPFLWRRLQGRIVRSIVRGCTVAVNGVIVAHPAGRLVRPARTSTEARS